MNAPTYISELTPAGRAAVAVVSVSGPRAVELVDRQFAAANRRPLAEQPLGRICFGVWRSAKPEQERGEELIVCRTATEEVEVHCHGGRAAVGSIVESLAADGGLPCDWSERAQRLARDPIAAEAEIALARSTTLRTARILLAQRAGALRAALDELLPLLDENELEAAKQRCRALLARAELGAHLVEPWRVALCGRPNVGKSSLINAIVGYERAIVFDQPGTTRDVLAARTALDGWPVELSDMAGLREGADELESAGIAGAIEHLATVDLKLLVIDASAGFTEDDRRLYHDLRPELLVVNKCDLVHETRVVVPVRVMQTAATQGAGIAELIEAIVNTLVPQPPQLDAAVPFTARQRRVIEEVLASLEAGRAGDAAEQLRAVDR